MKAIKWLDDHFEEFLLVVLLVLVACVMMLQVVVRKIPFIPSLQWAEEFCRFMWIMSVFLSLPYTIRKGNMLRVNVLVDLLPQVPRKIFNLCVDLLVTAGMALLAYYSIDVVFGAKGILASGELSPAMQWPMYWIYAVMLFGYALGVVRGIEMFIIHLKHFGEKELSTIEQTMADAAEETASAKRAEGGEG